MAIIHTLGTLISSEVDVLKGADSLRRSSEPGYLPGTW